MRLLLELGVAKSTHCINTIHTLEEKKKRIYWNTQKHNDLFRSQPLEGQKEEEQPFVFKTQTQPSCFYKRYV